MAEEPSLPQLPDSGTSNSRKRGHVSSLHVSDASSDPALFSSDDDPGLDNYVEGRRKRRYLGSWFHQRPVSPDSTVDIIKMPPPARRALTRHPDSGVFLGSDGSDSSDLPDFQCIPPRARLPLPARKISQAEELAREKIRACVESGTQDVDLVNMGLDDISEETVSILAHMQVFPTVRPDVAFEQRDPCINFFLGNNDLTRLPGAIFDLQYLTTLSLRNNELTEISPAIVKLTNLKELNLGQNRLRSFPSEILRLLLFGKLKRFFWGPNPLYQPDGKLSVHNRPVPWGNVRNPPMVGPNSEFPVLDVSASHRAEYHNSYLGRSPLQVSDSMGRVTSGFSLPRLDSKDDVPLHKPDRRIGLGDIADARKGVPSLIELCLRSGHRSSMTADLPLHMPDEFEHLRRLLQRTATQKAAGRLNCSSCGRLVVIPQAEWIEWHELRDRRPILPGQCSMVPFRYLACSRGCWPDVQACR
ncbi:Leucine Rich Repeat domain protein [Ophiocordyceps camponoti-floridani]|uniref:Leucine Rich Repeat domain protein n=1 Tax=Ophiocordyceps camponoti-floridani TaxID=2030778 RepID=A0A8H4Q5Z4_9HYPO|nr:Leucine Rich Repeat domain protein [Ophiocordyceps camponoti-floridani]